MASYSNISIETLKGLEDSGNPFTISSDKTPCTVNSEFTSYGSVRSRTKGLTLIGGDSSELGRGLALHSVCSCSDCDFSDPAFDPSNPCKLPKPSDYPTPAGNLYLVRAYEDSSCNTVMQYYDNGSLGWITFDNLDKAHEFDIVDDNCRLWYSNGYEDLRYACFSQGNNGACSVIASPAQPTCSSEYPNAKILTVIRAIANPGAGSGQTAGFLTFGRPFNGCDDGYKELCDYIKNNPRYQKYTSGTYSSDPTNNNYNPDPNLTGQTVPTGIVGQPNIWAPNSTKAKVCIKVRLYNCGTCDTTNTDGYTEYPITDLEVTNCCDRTIYWYDPSGAPPVGNFEEVCVSWSTTGGSACSGNKTFCPNYCCGQATLTAEGVKGYILKKHDNRLFIAGNLEKNLNDIVEYGAQNAQFGLITVPTHLGDFSDKGPYRTTGDGGYMRFDNSCAKVTAMSKIGSDLYFHRYSRDPELHRADLFVPNDNTIPGAYIPIQEHNSNAANWFRNVIVANGLQYYVSTFNGLNEVETYGVFEGFGFKTSKTKSNRIKRTMGKLDFTKGAMTLWDGKIYMAAKMKDQCLPTIKEFCDIYSEDRNFSGNDVLLVYDLATDNFTVWNNWYISAWHIVNNQLFAIDSRNANVYRVDTQLSDYASQQKVGDDFTFYWETKYFHYNQPIRAKLQDGVIVLGYISPGEELSIKTHLDCQKVLETKINYHDIDDPTNCVSEICSLCPALDCVDCEGDFNSKFFMVNIGYLEDTESFMRQKFSFTRTGGFTEIIGIYPRIRQISSQEADALSQCQVNITGKCFS